MVTLVCIFLGNCLVDLLLTLRYHLRPMPYPSPYEKKHYWQDIVAAFIALILSMGIVTTLFLVIGGYWK